MGLLAHLSLTTCLILAASPAGRAQDPRPGEAEGGTTLSPYFFVKSDDPASDQLPLKATRADVSIAGVIAEVKVTQVYRNEGRHPLEALYVFPGSTRAAVHAMRMTIGERTIDALIREKGQARRDYEQAKTEGRTASLLEQQRPNVFQMNVANILPGDEVKVELTYTELLVPTDGIYSFVYPTVVGPRYSSMPAAAAPASEHWVANPYTTQGKPATFTFDMAVRLDAGMPIQEMGCDTHKVALHFDGANSVRTELDPSEKSGSNRDFILKYRLSGGKTQSGLLLFKGKEENFFLVMAQPPRRVTPQDMPAREYVFIMDISGSQWGFPLDISKVLMKDMIQNLRPGDLFNVMVFEGSSALWSPRSMPVTKDNLKDALDFIRQQNGGGGTELGSALRRALTLPREPGMSRTFVLSTDGFIHADASVFDIVRDNLGSANLFAFGIGSSVNRHLIEGLAHVGMGEAFVVTRPQEAPAAAQRFRAYVSSPVLTNVKLTTNGFQVYDLEPAQLPDVLADRPVLCIGKWRGEPTGTVTLSGIGGAGTWNQTFDVAGIDSGERFAALRQLWARQKLQLLSDYGQFGESTKSIQETIRLGLTYNLLTAHTSFVAIDSQIRNAGGAQETMAVPLPLPQGVSNLAVGGTSAQVRVAPAAPTAGGRASDVASSVVEVVASVNSYSSACCASTNLGEEIVENLPAAAPSFRLGPLSADSRIPALEGFRAQLERKLKALMTPAMLKALPTALTLELRIDPSGTVVSARILPIGTGASLALKLNGWRIQGWFASRTSTLTVPVQVVR